MEQNFQMKLLKIYEKLLTEFGPRNWWPAKTPFEVMVGAVLAQAVAWRNVEKAIGNLAKNDLLSPEKIYHMATAELEELLKPTRYYKMKTKKLQSMVRFIVEEYQGNLAVLFQEDLVYLHRKMLGIYGLGPETVDSILLYAAGLPIFVVDEYTRRIFSRLGWVDQRISYPKLQEFFMRQLPPEVRLYNEMHALIVRLGNQVCHTEPQCNLCPIAEFCTFNLASAQNHPHKLPIKAVKLAITPNEKGTAKAKK